MAKGEISMSSRKKFRTASLLLVFVLLVGLCFGCTSPNEPAITPQNTPESLPGDTQPSESTQGDEVQNDYSVPDDSAEEDLSLSGVLYDFTFKLDGDTITLPLTLEEFQSYGWEPNLELAETMGGNTFSATGHTRNGKGVMLSIANMSDETLPIHESMVFSISSYYYDDYKSDYVNEDHAVIELPKGIVLGVSTIDDVIRAYGTPTYTYFTNDVELEQTLVYVYAHEDFRRGTWFGIEIAADKRKGNVVTSIDISNSVQ
jgi:hypothetical protein